MDATNFISPTNGPEHHSVTVLSVASSNPSTQALVAVTGPESPVSPCWGSVGFHSLSSQAFLSEGQYICKAVGLPSATAPRISRPAAPASGVGSDTCSTASVSGFGALVVE